jgi:DNA-binding Lrp family transcriptional regulator
VSDTKAYILIQTEPGTDARLARAVAAIPGVRGVDRVTGPFDLIAEAVAGFDGAVLSSIRGLDGVLRALSSLVLDGGTGPPTEVARDVAASGT